MSILSLLPEVLVLSAGVQFSTISHHRTVVFAGNSESCTLSSHHDHQSLPSYFTIVSHQSAQTNRSVELQRVGEGQVHWLEVEECLEEELDIDSGPTRCLKYGVKKKNLHISVELADESNSRWSLFCAGKPVPLKTDEASSAGLDLKKELRTLGFVGQ